MIVLRNPSRAEQFTNPISHLSKKAFNESFKHLHSLFLSKGQQHWLFLFFTVPVPITLDKWNPAHQNLILSFMFGLQLHLPWDN